MPSSKEISGGLGSNDQPKRSYNFLRYIGVGKTEEEIKEKAAREEVRDGVEKKYQGGLEQASQQSAALREEGRRALDSSLFPEFERELDALEQRQHEESFQTRESSAYTLKESIRSHKNEKAQEYVKGPNPFIPVSSYRNMARKAMLRHQSERQRYEQEADELSTRHEEERRSLMDKYKGNSSKRHDE